MFKKIAMTHTFKILSIICFAVLGSVSCGSQKKEISWRALHPVKGWCSPSLGKDGRLLPCFVDKNGQSVSGYVNEDGQLVIKNSQFEYTGEFNENLAPVRVEGKYGYINEKGEFAITPQFSDAKVFESVSEKLIAAVKIDGKYGYIDTSGNFVINPQFDEVGSFSHYFSNNPSAAKTKFVEIFAEVKIGDKWGFIDHTGNQVISPQYDAVGNFSEGLALVNVGDKCGYIDSSGRMAIALQFECTKSSTYATVMVNPKINELGDFSSWQEMYVTLSLARVKVIPERSTLNKIETKPPNPNVIVSGSEIDKSKYGYIDRTGKYIIDPQFEEAGDFSANGLAAVGFAQSLTGLFQTPQQQMDITGDEERDKITREQNANTPPVKEGITRIVKWGFINATGKIVINPIFDNVGSFSQDLAAVTHGGKCGYIDETGKYVIEPKFSKCENFSGGVAYVGQESIFVAELGRLVTKRLIIDRTGKIIFTYYSEN